MAVRAPTEITPLDEARAFEGRLLYGTPEQLDAVTLAFAVSHSIESFTAVPRVLFDSDDPGSGKSTGLHIAKLLCYRPWEATNSTEPAVRAKFNEGQVTLIVDEISKIFGESGTNGKTNKLYPILVSGYESTAVHSFSAGRITEDIPIYGVAVAAGLRKAAPNDLRDRCIIIHMKKAPGTVANRLEDALDPSVRAEGRQIGAALHQWARANADDMREYAKNRLRGLHPKLTGRRRQIWGPLFTVAAMAGGDWPVRCLRAFLELALDSGDKPVLTPRQQMLLDADDYATKYARADTVIFSRDLLEYVKGLEREEFAPMSDRALAKLMSSALGQAQAIRGVFVYAGDGEDTPEPHKGWYMHESRLEAADLRARLNMVLNEAPVLDEYDTMFA
jgi:uncharacterized protein DUF3631